MNRVVRAAMTFTVILLVGTAGRASGTAPAPDHKVTICHATASVTNPYVIETVDMASIEDFVTGSGHGSSGVNVGDIIPPFKYVHEDGTVFAYPGQGDQDILENGCQTPYPSATPTPSSRPSPSSSPTGETPSAQPSSSASPRETSTPSSVHYEAPLPNTATVPARAPARDTSFLIVLALAGALGFEVANSVIQARRGVVR